MVCPNFQVRFMSLFLKHLLDFLLFIHYIRETQIRKRYKTSNKMP